MNIFKTFKLTWWQGSIFKISMIALGIVIGAGWSDVFDELVIWFLIIFIVGASYITYIWWKQ